MKEAFKIVFLGTPDFAVDSLDILVNNGFNIVAVVTAPDQPAGRGQVLQGSPVKTYALAHGIKLLQPEKLKNPAFITELTACHADLFIVVAFRMLPEVVWTMPRLGTFNLHASLLPQYRGAAPINHAIINGETVTGLTTFFLKQEIDTGEIIFQEKISIYPEETAGELHDRMKLAGAQLVLKTTEAVVSGHITTTDQGRFFDPSVPLKAAPKIFRQDCRIDWIQSAVNIYNKIRGLSPYPAAYANFISPSGETVAVKIFKATLSKSTGHTSPGSIVTDGITRVSIGTSDGLIDIIELQQAGKRKMNTDEFLRGFRLNSDWRVG
jgi:methionyl-tRNA formyltransferase